ncbi:GATA zinc finger, partial [Colletotrichum paranaense]
SLLRHSPPVRDDFAATAILAAVREPSAPAPALDNITEHEHDHDLPSFRDVMEEATALATLALPQTNLETISRPSSTSTSESASAAAVVAAASTVPQLPGISALAQANNSATSSPQMRYRDMTDDQLDGHDSLALLPRSPYNLEAISATKKAMQPLRSIDKSPSAAISLASPQSGFSGGRNSRDGMEEDVNTKVTRASCADFDPQRSDSRARSRCRLHTDSGARARASSRADADLRFWRRIHHAIVVNTKTRVPTLIARFTPSSTTNKQTVIFFRISFGAHTWNSLTESFATISLALRIMMATQANESTQPTCQNCQTSTTPLWRRDEYGSVLCNACGLFLKLHGRPRPISLKTDVIKSRNRVKTMRPDLASKKKQQQQQQQAHQFGANDPNGLDIHGQNQRRQSQKSNGNPDGSDSPVSRTATPSLYNPSLPVFQGMDDAQLQAGLQGFNVSGSDNRSGSPLNGDRHLDVPQTHEQLIAANSALKTRVSELELINELFRGRLSQMEQDEASARRGQEISGKAEAQLRAQLESSKKQLDESHRRENNLKRRLDEMELELKEARDALDLSDSGRAAKKPRIAEVVANPAVAAATSGGGGDGGGGGESEVSTPQSAAAN